MISLLGHLRPAHAAPTDGEESIDLRGPLGGEGTIQRLDTLNGRLTILAAGRTGQASPFGVAEGVEVAAAGDWLGWRGPGSVEDPQGLADAISQGGVEALEHLRGGFAVAVIDHRRDVMHLGRDPTARWPLYLARHTDHEGIWFGTSATEVARRTGRADALDPEAVEDYWTEGFVRPTRTIFRGVQALDPGQSLVMDLRDPAAPWRPGPELSPAVTQRWDGESPAQVHETLGVLLGEAIGRCVAGRPDDTCLTLSGGVDSTLVVDMALAGASEGAEAFEAITLGSLIPFMNDERFARFAARRLGVRLRASRPHLRSLTRTAHRSFQSLDQPISMQKYFVLFALMEDAAATGRGVVLTGDCADGLFLGFDRPEKWLPTDGETARPVVPFGPALPPWLGAYGRDQVANHSAGHLVAKQHHLTVGLGLAVRSPFLDWDLMGYVRSLPQSLILQPGQSKGLLKAHLSHWPTSFVERPKMGFGYNLRWAWAAQGLTSLRRMVDADAVERFAPRLPEELRGSPAGWRRGALLRHFDLVSRLASWSAFRRRAIEPIAH